MTNSRSRIGPGTMKSERETQRVNGALFAVLAEQKHKGKQEVNRIDDVGGTGGAEQRADETND